MKILPFVNSVPNDGQQRIQWIRNGDALMGASTKFGSDGNLNIATAQVQANVVVLDENLQELNLGFDANTQKIQEIEALLEASGSLDLVQTVQTNTTDIEQLKLDSTETKSRLTSVETETNANKTMLGDTGPNFVGTVNSEIEFLKARIGNNINETVNGTPNQGAPATGVKLSINNIIAELNSVKQSNTELNNKVDLYDVPTLKSGIAQIRTELGPTPVSKPPVYTMLDSLTNDSRTFSTDIETIKSKIAFNNPNSIDARVGSLENDYLTLENTVNGPDGLTTHMSVVESEIDLLNPAVDTLQTQVANIDTSLSGADGLSQQVQEIKAHVGIVPNGEVAPPTSLEGRFVTLKDIQNDTSSTVQDLQVDVLDLRTDVDKKASIDQLNAIGAGHKAYLTLAAAQAAQASLTINTIVEVTNDSTTANNGTYQWNGTTLTKSAYDPLTQSLKKTQSLLPINFTFNTKLANVNRLSANVAFSKHINNIEKVDAISSSTTTTFVENVVLNNFSSVAVESIRKLKISNPLGDVANVILLHSDSVTDGQKTTRWIDFDVSNLSTATVNTDADGGFRVLCPFVNANVDLSTGLVNAYDVSEFFTSVAQTTISTTALNCISTHGSSAIQFKVMPSTLTDFGYALTTDGASTFIQSILSRLRIKVRSTTVKTAPFELENCLIEKGVYSFTFENLTASFDYSKLINNKIEAEGNAYDSYSTSVLNSTTAPIENGIVALKVNFEIGQVKSDDQIRVFDENGTEFDVQFAPDAYVNAREDLSIGYHFDGSLRAGTLYIIDDLAIDASKIYEVRVYQSALKKAQVKPEIVAENGNMIRYGAFGYQFEFSKILDNYGLTKVFLKDATQITISNIVKMYVANTTDPAVISSFAIGADRKLRVINEGNIFVDIEFSSKNSAFRQLESNVLAQKTIYRIFNNGVVKIMSRASALTDIDTTKLYGIQNTLFSDTASSSATFSAKYSLVRATFNSNPIRIKAMMYHGDSHRDGINYGANRPANAFNSVSTSSIDLRFGWRDSVGSESSTTWNIKNGDTWLSEIAITLEPTTLPDSQYTAILNHVPTGFIGKRQLWTTAKNQLLSSVYDYSFDSIEWWYSADAEPYGGNPNYPTATMYVYSTELMRFIKDGVGSFDAIYNKFIAMVKGRFGADLSKVGDAYAAGTFAISQESRHIAPALQWLYQHALKVGDTAKQNELKVLAKSIADALAGYYAEKGGIGLVGNGSDLGSSNVLGNGMRFLAIAIAMGQDATGAMLTAFNGCEARLIDTTKFMPFQNRLDDGLGDIEAKSRYLHYVAYAIYGYRLACSLLNREPAFDITPFMLNSLSGNGDVKDYEYCVSESRRGERNTIGFMLHALTHKHFLGHIYAANAVMQSLITNGMDEKANPKRMFGFDGNTSDPDNLRTSVAFNLHALADLWLSFYYRFYK